MLRAGGVFRGASLLVSGASGTGKTVLASQLVDAACRRGERCMIFALEESAGEICRNARSIGIDLERSIAADLLRLEATRPSYYGLEMHLAPMHREIEAFAPAVVVVDPISAFRGPAADVHATLLRLVDLLKGDGITGVFTSLRSGGSFLGDTDQGLSSLMDGWIRLTDVEADGERNRLLYVIKARGMSHSNQVREYRITDAGFDLAGAYVGPHGVLTGTARVIQEARERAEAARQAAEREARRRELARRRAATERQIADLRAALESDEAEERQLALSEETSAQAHAQDQAVVFARRGAAE